MRAANWEEAIRIRMCIERDNRLFIVALVLPYRLKQLAAESFSEGLGG